MRERKLAMGWVPDFLVHVERSFADEHYRLDGGESLAMTAARGLDAIAGIARTAKTDNPAIASHGNLIAAVLRTMDPSFGFEAWRSMRNPHVFEVEFVEEKPVSFHDIG
jgi:2,3-bisphosphoglycerate-dependent phosphoglycerate mutase